MRVTYYALQTLTVGDSIRQPGDLVPEARDWQHTRGMVTDGRLAPVLVATLPEATKQMLEAWEAAQVEVPEEVPVESTEDLTVTEQAVTVPVTDTNEYEQEAV